jgi:hypothetical protein
MEEQIKGCLRDLLGSERIDSDTLDYFRSVVSDQGKIDEAAVKESLAPLLEAHELAATLEDAESLCVKLCDLLRDLGLDVKTANSSSVFDTVLLSSCIQLSQVTKAQISDAEQAAIDSQWGFDKIRAKRNDVIETSEAGSGKLDPFRTNSIADDRFLL